MLRCVIWQLFFGDLSQSGKLSEIKIPLVARIRPKDALIFSARGQTHIEIHSRKRLFEHYSVQYWKTDLFLQNLNPDHLCEIHFRPRRPMPSWCFLKKANFYHKYNIKKWLHQEAFLTVFSQTSAYVCRILICLLLLFLKSIHFCMCILEFGHSEKASKIWNHLPLDLMFACLLY